MSVAFSERSTLGIVGTYITEDTILGVKMFTYYKIFLLQLKNIKM